jgi:cytochrome d ubiquinol oxidase subunit II
MFLQHGALWIAIKTDGAVSARAASFSSKTWYLYLMIAVAFLVSTGFATDLYSNFIHNPEWVIVPVLAVFSLVGTKWFMSKNKYQRAFFASGLTILMVVFTGVVGLYPNLIPSSLDTNFSLTIFNSSSSIYTLKIMSAVALIFVPIVIVYQSVVYRVLRSKSVNEDIDVESY